jgi:hypothetical protein
MQSSARNSLKLRLTAASHSAQCGLRLAFAPAPEDQPSRCTDTAGDEKAERQCSDCRGRQVGAQLAGDVRRLADALAQIVCGIRELLALRLEFAADDLDGARVSARCHCSSAPLS